MTPTTFWDDVAFYLEDEGLGTAGSDIKVGKLDSEPNNQICILGLPGFEQPSRYIREFIYPRFQIIIRNTDYDLGVAKLMAVREKLHVKIGIMFGAHYVLRCHAEQEGGPIGSDEEGRYEFSINFTAQARYVTPDSSP